MFDYFIAVIFFTGQQSCHESFRIMRLEIGCLIRDNGVCGTGQSGNSIVQSAQAKLAIYYESYGLTQTETSDIKINLDCWGYFLCKSNSDCSVYEGGEGSPTCNQANGACENLCTPG